MSHSFFVRKSDLSGERGCFSISNETERVQAEWEQKGTPVEYAATLEPVVHKIPEANKAEAWFPNLFTEDTKRESSGDVGKVKVVPIKRYPAPNDHESFEDIHQTAVGFSSVEFLVYEPDGDETTVTIKLERIGNTHLPAYVNWKTTNINVHPEAYR